MRISWHLIARSMTKGITVVHGLRVLSGNWGFCCRLCVDVCGL